MDVLISQILALQKVSEALEPSKEDRNNMQEEIQNFANHFIDNLESYPAFNQSDVNIESLKLTATKSKLPKILQAFNSEVVLKGIKPASGGHVGYIPGGGIYTAALGDFLASITNEYAGMYYASPGAVTMEEELLNWMKQLFGFPKNAVGNLTSGGSIANMIALTSARDKYQIKNEKIGNSVIYLSEQVHHCVLKALRIIGLEDIKIQYLELDELSRIDVKKLEEFIQLDIEKGLNPFLVVASTGTTDTGAVDPLDSIGRVAKKNNLWFHIDGAYGGFFILSDSKKQLFKGIELADSLVVDPHKGLFLPYGIGAVLVKDKKAVFHSHHYTANYMQDAMLNDVINPADVSPELTKHFRGLRMWIPFKLHGTEPFIACLNEKLLLTTYFRNRLRELDFCLGPEPDLTVSYFWYPSNEVEENVLNKKLMELIHEDGTIFLSSTVVNDKFVIRMAIGSFRTKKATIDKAIKMIHDCLIKTKKELGILKK